MWPVVRISILTGQFLLCPYFAVVPCALCNFVLTLFTVHSISFCVLRYLDYLFYFPIVLTISHLLSNITFLYNCSLFMVLKGGRLLPCYFHQVLDLPLWDSVVILLGTVVANLLCSSQLHCKLSAFWSATMGQILTRYPYFLWISSDIIVYLKPWHEFCRMHITKLRSYCYCP